MAAADCQNVGKTLTLLSEARMTSDDFVADLKSSDNSRSSLRMERDGLRGSVDVNADGSMASSLIGQPPDGELGEHLVCLHLVEHLNQEGGSWGALTFAIKDARKERGVDGWCHNLTGAKLQIQVTHADGEVWARLNQAGSVSAVETSTAPVLEAMVGAIENKRLHASADVVLALDATMSALAVMPAVIQDFRREHGTWAADVGYAEVWVVGPTADNVFRLDNT